jgi:hypothetical protein
MASERGKVVQLPTKTAIALKDASSELDSVIDDLFYIVKLYGIAGDRAMAQEISKHAHGLQALRWMRKS